MIGCYNLLLQDKFFSNINRLTELYNICMSFATLHFLDAIVFDSDIDKSIQGRELAFITARIVNAFGLGTPIMFIPANPRI